MTTTIQNWGSAFVCQIEFNGIIEISFAKYWGVALLKCYCKIQLSRLKNYLK